MKLNYPDMLQNIKMSIFTGDHSGVYSLACAIACIAAIMIAAKNNIFFINKKFIVQFRIFLKKIIN